MLNLKSVEELSEWLKVSMMLAELGQNVQC